MLCFSFNLMNFEALLIVSLNKSKELYSKKNITLLM